MTGLSWLKALLAAVGIGWLLGGSTSTPATTTVAPGAGVALPQSFFGVSIEYPELPMYERFTPAFERILGLWTVAGDGPFVIRIGGASADRTYWEPGPYRLPARAYLLTNRWFANAASLIAQAGLRVILDLNLKHGTAQLEAAMAAKALSALPSGSVAGLEIGNEPDRYLHGYTPGLYANAVSAYAAALASVAPGIPLLAPAVSNTATGMPWLRYTAGTVTSELGALDGHRYQLGGCVGPTSRRYPSVSRMLSSKMTTGLVAAVEPAVQLAHLIGKPFRLDELGSVTCGGVPGVSNSFATALWAPDALFSLWAAGLDAVNVHIRADRVNGPLQIGPLGFTARPLFYGLALFSRAASPGGQLLPIRITSPSGISGWAVQVSTGALHVVLLNKGATDANVRLAFPDTSSVTVQRLLAPSVAATSGVTLAGQQLAPDGQLVGPFVSETLSPRDGVYTVAVPAGSAALVIAQH